MKAGITGLPFSGKTTLFCALTGQDYSSLAHGREVHPGIVPVPDSRLDRLFDMFQPKKKTPAVMEYFDIAGKAASEGKGMDPKILQTLKTADSLVVVIDAFTPGGNPRADLDRVIEEFVLTDLIVAESRLERLAKELRSKKEDRLVKEQDLLLVCRDILEKGERLTGLGLADEEDKMLRGFQFLSLKPLLIVANIGESALSGGQAAEMEARFAGIENARCAAICAEIEMEVASLESPEERAEFLSSLNITEPAVGRLIRMSYDSLGLMSFFTAGGTDEVRAWTVRKGATAPECAGAIHTDLERGFIRAETVSYDDLMRSGSFKAARDQGLLRIEGKDYVVRDGDILTIRFNV